MLWVCDSIKKSIFFKKINILEGLVKRVWEFSVAKDYGKLESSSKIDFRIYRVREWNEGSMSALVFKKKLIYFWQYS